MTLWAVGDPPPRAGNALDVLVEGAACFTALERATREARRSVLIAGWCITPQLALVRGEPPMLLRELLAEAAESVDDLWRPIAAEQRERSSRGEPPTHGLVELPAISRRAERLLRPLQALLVDG